MHLVWREREKEEALKPVPMKPLPNQWTMEVNWCMFCRINSPWQACPRNIPQESSKFLTSAMLDVPTDEQELPEPVKLRAICEVSDEWEKLGRIQHQRTNF